MGIGTFFGSARLPTAETQQDRRRLLQMLAAAPLLGCTTAPRAATQRIAHDDFVRIGGIEQWLSIRGASAEAPILLFLHGGPGEAMSPFASMLAPWERVFTVALWDQRGAGKTFGRQRDAQGEMSLSRLTADVLELAEHLRHRFGKRKIVLAGQSWGSVLGWNAIQTRPDLFSAYVGTGQGVSWSRSMHAQELYARAQAEAAHDSEALAALEAAQRLPLSDTTRTNPLRRWIMAPADQDFLAAQRKFTGAPPFPETGDVADWVGGFIFSSQALTPDVLAFDAYATGPSAEIPVVMIQGRDDHVTPTDVVAQFVADLRAPSKALVLIEGGHFSCYTNAITFSSALAEHVRPLAA